MSQLSCKPANGVSGSTFLSQWYWCLVNTAAEEKVILVSENDLFLTLGLGTSNARNETLPLCSVRSQDTRITLQMLGRVALSSLGSVILVQVFRNRISYIENI